MIDQELGEHRNSIIECVCNDVFLAADGYSITISHGTIAVVLAVGFLLVLLLTIFALLHQSALTAKWLVLTRN